MDEDIKSNGWGIKKISVVENSLHLINIFQTFYQITGRLLLSNGLLVVPDGDPPPGEDRVNIKSLHDMFRHTNSYGLVSLSFLGVLQYYFEKNNFGQIKRALTELYQNLSYITLSGARDFDFTANSDLIARISYFMKSAARSNIEEMEKADVENAYKINNNVSFVPKTEKPLDVVIDILDKNIEHKKLTHPHVPPQVKTADEIEIETQATNDEFAKLKAEYDRINDAATEQKKQTEIIDLVDDILDEKNPFQDLGTEDIWIDDDLFDDKDPKDVTNTSRDIIKEIKDSDPFLDFSIPTDAIIDNLFEPSDDDESELIIAKPAVSDEKIIVPYTNEIVPDIGPPQLKKIVATYMKGTAEKVKEKYKRQRKKKIGQLNKQNKVSADWLKQAGYLDTEDLDTIQNNCIKNNKNAGKTNSKDDTVGDIID